MITVDILKAQLGGIQTKLNFDTVKPFVRSAERWFRGEIGPELFAWLNGLDPDPDTEEAELLELAQACMSWHAYDLAFPHLKLRVGDNGIMKSVPQQHVAVTKWEYIDSRDANLAMVDLMLEMFWQVLEELRPEVWVGTEAYSRRQHLFIRSASELGKLTSIVGRNNRFFQKLIPYIIRAEEFYLEALLTPELMADLKIKWVDLDGLSDVEQRLIDLLRPALAHYALFEAYPYLSLVVDQNGIRQARFKDGTAEEENPEPNLRNAQRRQLHQDAQAYLVRARKLLDTMASTTMFVPYYTAQLANQTEDDDYSGTAHVLV